MTDFIAKLTALGLWAVLVAGALLLAMRWMTRPRRGEPTCGRCRYIVIGLPMPVCPECGGDLRQVGILEPGQYQWGLGGCLVLWTLLMVVFMMPFVVVCVENVIPQVSRSSIVQPFSAPRSGRYKSLDVETTEVGLSWLAKGAEPQFTIKSVEFRLVTLSDTVVSMTIQPPHDEPQLLDASYREGTSWMVKNDLIKWMREAGVDADGSAVAAEAEVVASAARSAAAGEIDVGAGSQFANYGNYYRSRWSEELFQWGGEIGAGCWVFVWALGFWRLMRRSGQTSIGADKAGTTP